MNTDTHLFNRFDAAPNFKWMHVCPLGEHAWQSADGAEHLLQVIDREACEAMARTYPLSIPNSRIDVDHESMDADKRTAAVGWGRKAEAREDGLWVEVEWNPEGRDLVANKVYRFSSPCFPRDGLVDLGDGRVRVTKLGVIALTNDPNLRGQKPLTNRRAQSANPNTKPTSTMDYKSLLLTLLGLPADASDDAVNKAAAAAKSANTEAKTEKEAMQNRVAELETQLVNHDLDAHGITDPAQRKLLTSMLANKASRTDALSLVASLKAAAAAKVKEPLHNRNGAKTPDTLTQLSKGDSKAEAEDQLHNRAVAYRHKNQCSYEQALAAVRSLPADAA